jgi:hypothetical protein
VAQWMKDNKITVDLDANVVAWLQRRNIAVNDDFTVTLCKAVRDDYTSSHLNHAHVYPDGVKPSPFTYEVGKEVVAPDYRRDANCGHGLHFSPTFQEARQWVRGVTVPRALWCNVDLATLVVIDETKVKSERCTVVEEFDPKANDYANMQVTHAEWLKNTTQVAKDIAAKMGKAARKAVEGES